MITDRLPSGVTKVIGRMVGHLTAIKVAMNATLTVENIVLYGSHGEMYFMVISGGIPIALI